MKQSLADYLIEANFHQCSRKGDLFASGCARMIWDWIRLEVRKEIEHIERRCEDPTLPEFAESAIEDGYGTPILDIEIHPDASALDEPLKLLFCANADDWAEAEFEFAEHRERSWYNLARDIFGNPFRPVTSDPAWCTADTLGIAGRMYDSREFAAMPILADALEEAGCTNPDVLLHAREPGVHVRGCWVVDLVLGKS